MYGIETNLYNHINNMDRDTLKKVHSSYMDIIEDKQEPNDNQLRLCVIYMEEFLWIERRRRIKKSIRGTLLYKKLEGIDKSAKERFKEGWRIEKTVEYQKNENVYIKDLYKQYKSGEISLSCYNNILPNVT